MSAAARTSTENKNQIVDLFLSRVTLLAGIIFVVNLSIRAGILDFFGLGNSFTNVTENFFSLQLKLGIPYSIAVWLILNYLPDSAYAHVAGVFDFSNMTVTKFSGDRTTKTIVIFIYNAYIFGAPFISIGLYFLIYYYIGQTANPNFYFSLKLAFIGITCLIFLISFVYYRKVRNTPLMLFSKTSTRYCKFYTKNLMPFILFSMSFVIMYLIPHEAGYFFYVNPIEPQDKLVEVSSIATTSRICQEGLPNVKEVNEAFYWNSDKSTQKMFYRGTFDSFDLFSLDSGSPFFSLPCIVNKSQVINMMTKQP